jgi:RNA-binding protein Nova
MHGEQMMDGAPQKRQRTSGEGNNAVLKQGPAFLKLLCNDHLAGAIIGKSGATLKQLQQATGATVRFTNPGVHFEGTAERVCAVSGQREQVQQMFMEMCQLNMDKVHEPASGDFKMSLLLPNQCVALLIGKGGERIKDLMQRSGAKVKCAPQMGGMERSVAITGTFESVVACGVETFTLVQQDAEILAECIDLQLGPNAANAGRGQRGGYGTPHGGYGGGGGGGMGGGMMGGHGMRGGGFVGTEYIGGAEASLNCAIEFHIQEDMVGAAIGKQGAVLKAIESQTGVQIKIASREEAIEGHRKFTLKGPMGAVHMAHSQVLQRVNASLQRDHAKLMQQLKEDA